MFLEIELKLHIDPSDAKLLHEHPLIVEHTQSAAEQHYLTSIYYDTAFYNLYKQGFGFRVRQAEQRFFQTLKSTGERKGDLHYRHEWEAEIASIEPELAVLAPDIQAQIIQILGNELLQPIFKTQFQRTSWPLLLSDGTQVEIALDFGEVCTSTQKEPLSELELELKAGDAAKLYEVAAVLSKSIPLSVEARSKAARGYNLLSTAKLEKLGAESRI